LIAQQSILNVLVFSCTVLACIFILVLGSKMVLSHCETDQNGECITVGRAADIAVEIVQLNQQLATARAYADEECTLPEISFEDWNSGNSKVLEGCWQLKYNYTMYYGGDPERPNSLVDWGFCLESPGGYALQDLVFEDGLQCINQKLFYDFVENQDAMQLQLMDNEDILCTIYGAPGPGVVQRELLCSLNSSGDFAECRSRSKNSEIWNDGIVLRRRP
jgi:hypothetical protein